MNTSIAQYTTSICRLTVLAAVISALLACSEADSEQSGSMGFSTGALQRQLGYVEDPQTSTLVAPVGSESTSVARSILIGAIVVRSRSFAQGPYTDRTPITDLETQLEDDVLNSVNLFKLFNLPSADSNVLLEIPPAGTKKWQVIAGAFSTQPATIEEITQLPHKDALVYIAFGSTTPGGQAVFFKTGNGGEVFELNAAGNPTGPPLAGVSLTMKRACLININPDNPPKGCAQFKPGVNAPPLISAGVEVTRIEVDSGVGPVDVTPAGAPFIVRLVPGAGEDDPLAAQAAIGTLFNPVSVAGPHISVEVFTTHQLAPGQAGNALCTSATTVIALEANCTVESYFTPGQ